VSSPTEGPTAELKLYRRPMPFWWWLHSGPYFRSVVRELTCIFVGVFAVLTLEMVQALGQGPEAYAAFAARLGTSAYIVFSLVAFAAVLYHALTWFALVPTTMRVRLGDERVPDRVIAGAHYAAWVVASLVVAFIVLRG
jgi:fumarate reductase subunit C